MQVAGQLWQLVVVHAELPMHLAALKDYFLLARGDFYQAFLHEVAAAAYSPMLALLNQQCAPSLRILGHRYWAHVLHVALSPQQKRIPLTMQVCACQAQVKQAPACAATCTEHLC